jgi:hypothetical protein
MADYDWDMPKLTPEELAIRERRDAELSARRIESYRCALAEARQMLISGEAELYHTLEFVNELAARIKTAETDAARQAWLYLENHGELAYSETRTVKAGDNVKAPDAQYLSGYQPYAIPKQAVTNVGSVKQEQGVNSTRALLTQAYLETKLSEGAVIKVENADGSVEEIEFTREWLDN